jgi:hypothetical protein
MGDNRETSIYEQVAAAFEAEGDENPEESAPAATEEPAQEDVPPAQETEPAQEETAPATVPAAPASAPVDSTAMLMAMIQQQNQQIAQMQAMIQNQNAAISQQSQAAETAIDNAMTQPAVEVQIPVLDMGQLQYQSPEEQQAALGAWQQAMVDAITNRVSAQYEPIRRSYEDNQRIAANEAAKASLANNPMFSDFRANESAIEAFLQQNPELAGMDAGKRYALGALAVRGRNYDPTAKPTDDQIVEMVMKSPGAQKMLDARRAQAVQQKNAEIPTVAPSVGYSSASAVPKPEAPQNLEELREGIRSIFHR